MRKLFHNIYFSPRQFLLEHLIECHSGLSVKNSNKYFSLLLVTGFILSSLTFCFAAQDIKITAKADPAETTVGGSFYYQVEVSGSRTTLPTPDVNFPSAFNIISGPNSSINYQYVNGQVNSSKVISWRLVAREAGDFTIPPPKTTVKRKIQQGPSVKVRVRPAAGNVPPGKNPSASPGVPSSTNIRIKGDPKSNQPLFLEIEVEPKHAYIQQPVTVTYTLFFRQDVRTFDVKSLSTTEGFWSENLKVPNPPQVINRMVNGREYRSAVIHKLLLYPTRHGELSIGPMDLTLEIQEKRKSRRSRSLFDNFFDDPFGTSRVQKQVSSKPKIVKVKPLPDLGRPAGFDGAVGEYKINARLDRDTVNTNESVTLKVTISGNGNIGFLPEQSISIPPDIERYDPEIKEHAEPLGGKLHGKKTFTYLLIPRRAGLQRITPIKFSFFDPVKGKYVTSSTNELLLQVNPVEGWTASGAVIPGGSPEEVQSLATDIRWIHDATQGLHRAEKPVYRRATYPLAYIIPLIFAVTALFARKRRNKFQSDTAARKSRMAAKHAYKALKEAKELQDAGKIDQGYTALARGLINYFSDRTGNVSSTVDRNRIDLVLQHRHVPENLRIKVASIIDKCNSARFTPDGLDNISLTRLIEESRTWIHNVNHYLE